MQASRGQWRTLPAGAGLDDAKRVLAKTHINRILGNPYSDPETLKTEAREHARVASRFGLRNDGALPLDRPSEDGGARWVLAYSMAPRRRSTAAG